MSFANIFGRKNTIKVPADQTFVAFYVGIFIYSVNMK